MPIVTSIMLNHT